jgi:DeoR family fructose operon transcriptional repressor
MFATERLNIIKSYLKEHKRLDVHTVSELLNVSEVTIRRDLEKLESDGYLTRIHGGAIPVETEREEILPVQPGTGAEGPAFREQDEIARVASLMIRDGGVVALLNGAVCRQLARRLSVRAGLTVITNDLQVAMEIAGHASNKAVLLGGNADRGQQSVFGSLSLSTVRNYYFDYLFVEIDGINEQLAVTIGSQEKADLVRESMACAREPVALCLAENFGRSALFRLGFASAFRKVVTSTKVPDEYKSRLFGAGIQVFTSVNAFEGST